MTSLLPPRTQPASAARPEIRDHLDGGHRPERDRSCFRARLTDRLAAAVGTEHGLFMVSNGRPDGPIFSDSVVPAFLQIGKRYYVATIDSMTGPALRMSDDGGQSWSDPAATLIALPGDVGAKLLEICQIQPDYSSPGAVRAGAVFVGVGPAALFRSADGISFELVRGLWDHPDRTRWGGGPESALHTVLTHPARPGRIIVVIRNGGVYRSDNSGETWQARNVGLGMQSDDCNQLPTRQVYKVAFDAFGPDALFAQTDSGTYRSEDGGESWRRVGRSGEVDGLASDFGFPVVGHPVEAGTAYVFPLESEASPCNPGGRPRVYRTTDGGARWGMLGDGLPYENAHVTVLGDAFTIGEAAPYALVLGTKAGELFASLDQGDRWRLVTAELPPVLCVRVLE